MVWKSEWIPSVWCGGMGSPVVADGKVFLFGNIRKPKDGGKKFKFITTEMLVEAGWNPDLPDDLVKKIEAARVSTNRPAINGYYPDWSADEMPKVADLDALKPTGDQQISQGIWVQRADVGQIADVARKERVPAGRVDGFEHDLRAGPELVIRRFEQTHQVVGLHVFDDLRGEDPAERGVWLGEEISQGVARGGFEPAVPADGGHFLIEVDAPRGDALFPEQIEELPAAAADVEHVPDAFGRPTVGPRCECRPQSRLWPTAARECPAATL